MTEAEVLALICDVVASLEPEKARVFESVTLESELDDLGIDSILTLEVIGLLEDRLATTFPDDKLASLHSIRCLANLVQRYWRTERTAGPPRER